MQKTKIEYLDYTWNITHGCSPISEGCTQCWAESMSKRLAGMRVRGYDLKNSFRPTFCPWKLAEPQEIKKPSLVGISFMGDLFHEGIEWNDLRDIFQVISETIHTYIVLTKRPELMKTFCDYYISKEMLLPDNLWLGVTVELEKYLWRVEELLKIPSAVKFVSVEPMLGPMDIRSYFTKGVKLNLGSFHYIPGISWIIAGCESGSGRRQTEIQWFRDLKNQCVEANIPFFLKQANGYINGKSTVVKLPELDGQQWKQFPILKEK